MRDDTYADAVGSTDTTEGGEEREASDRPAARRRAFRIVAVPVSLIMLVLMVFGLMEVVLMWLPWDTLMSFIDDLRAGDEIHRAHYNMLGILSWALLVQVVVQLRRPERRVAAMLGALGITLGGALVYGLSGTLMEWVVEDVMPVVLVGVLVALHPRAREMFRRPKFERRGVWLVAVAAGPWLVFAVDHAVMQWRFAAADPHAQVEHWASAALVALTILWCALIGSSDHTGWQVPAWIAALASIEYGVHAMVFPDAVSTVPVAWALAAVVWGVAFAVVTVQRSRTTAPAESIP